MGACVIAVLMACDVIGCVSAGMQLLGGNPCRGIMPWGIVTIGPWFKMAGMGAAVDAW